MTRHLTVVGAAPDTPHPADIADEYLPARRADTTDPRTPPHDESAEIAVLGACLLDADAVREARAVVAPDDCYREGHRHLLAAVYAVADAGEVPDPLTVRAALERAGTLDAAGGRDYLDWLMDAVPTAANVKYHAKIVRDRAAQRRLGAELQRIAANAWEPGADPQAIAAAGVQALLPQAAAARAGFVPLKSVLWDAMETIEARAKGERRDVVSLGIPELDGEPVEGAEAGDLVTLLLVSGHGKTALALSMMRWAAEAGTECAIVSAEMPAKQIANRILSGYSGISFGRLRRGRLYDSEWPALTVAASRVAALPCHVDDTALPALRDVRAKIMALKAAHPGLALVFVDYVQLLSANEKQRTLEIEQVTYGLKGLAKQCGVVVVQLAQPDGKDIDRRGTDNKMPQLADIAWSQAIRNASDLVVCGYRPGKYDKMEEDDRMLLSVQKSRASGDHEFWLHWTGPSMLCWSPQQPAPYLTSGPAPVRSAHPDVRGAA